MAAVRTTPEAPDLQRLLADMLEAGVTHCVMEVSSHALEPQAGLPDRIRRSRLHQSDPRPPRLPSDHGGLLRGQEKAVSSSIDKPKRTAVVNGDDPWGQKLIADLPMTTVGFGFESVGPRPGRSGPSSEAGHRSPGPLPGRAVSRCPVPLVGGNTTSTTSWRPSRSPWRSGSFRPRSSATASPP